jgi:hypothetical protein
MPKCGDVAAEAFETLMVVAELRAQGELGADFGHLGECAEKLYRVHLSEMDAESGALCRRFLRPSHPR